MAQVTEKDLDTVTRRLSSVTSHLIPVSAALNRGSIQLCNTSKDDKYHRIHGQVGNKEVVWRKIPSDESGKEFTDIIYEKAVGEGIAKVSSFINA